MYDRETELPVREALVASIIVKPEIPSVDHRIGLHMGSQLVDDPELAVGVADQQESHGVTSELGCAIRHIVTGGR